LENRRSKNDEMSGRMWEVVEAETRKIGVAKKKKRKRKKERSKKREK